MAKKILFFLLFLFTLNASAERVLVFPFTQQNGDIKTLWLEMGLAAAVEESLSYNNILCVSIDDLENYFKEQNLVSQPNFSLSAQLGLARTLGATHLLSGKYKFENGLIVVECSFFDLEYSLKKGKEIAKSDKIENLRSIAEDIAKIFVESCEKSFKSYPSVAPEAFESYIRGRIATDPILKEVYFRKATELAPDYYEAKCLLAIVLEEENNTTESMKILEELKNKNYSKSSLGLRFLDELKMKQGKLSEAIELIKSSLKSAENSESHLLLAKIYLKQGKKEDALKEIRIAESFGTHGEETQKILEEINR
ncbi:MAG: tetratricopeptide repeat protein [Thermoanaerobaculaceae bacterium]|nr:tetratricopeptide repeat protein [Thermoanaerobaculaceae bacterium]